MHEYLATDSVIQILGALSLAEVDGGVRPRRLPDSLRNEIPSHMMTLMIDSAAGVRLRFATSATKVIARLRVHPIELLGVVPVFSAAVDLVVDGRFVDSKPVTGASASIDVLTDQLEVPAGDVMEVVFEGLSSAMKVVEIWLPQTAVVDVVGVRADQPLEAAQAAIGDQWIHHGSSISHCLEAIQPTHTWPAVAANALGLELLDLAYAGQAMLDPFVARAIRDAPADLITLKLGINLVNANAMTLRSFGPAVHGFLDTIRDGHPTTPLVVISPICCPLVEDRPGPTALDSEGQLMTFAAEPYALDALTLGRIRELLSAIVAQRAATDPKLFYLDGRELFSEVDANEGHLPDGLHPDDDGYRMIGLRFADALRRLVE